MLNLVSLRRKAGCSDACSLEERGNHVLHNGRKWSFNPDKAEWVSKLIVLVEKSHETDVAPEPEPEPVPEPVVEQPVAPQPLTGRARAMQRRQAG